MAVSLLRHDFYIAEIFRVLGPEIDAEFGPNLLDLRQRCYSSDQLSMLIERRREHEEPPGAVYQKDRADHDSFENASKDGAQSLCHRDRGGRLSMISPIAQAMRFSSTDRVTSLSGQMM